MRLAKILDGVPGITEAFGNPEVAGIVADSRHAFPGSVFVCMPGENLDAHDFAPQAVKRGAAAIIATRKDILDSLKEQGTPVVLVEDARDACWKLCKSFYGPQFSGMRLVGVTGTNGKTTVAWLLAQILNRAGIPCAYIGTLGARTPEKVIATELTTPFPPELYSLLAGFSSANVKACVLEVSSHALDQKRVFGLDFEVAVFTNLSQDHLDYHRNLEEYFLAKRKLFVGLPGAAPATVANCDDSYGKRLLAEAPKSLSYGECEAADLRLLEANVAIDSLDWNADFRGANLSAHAPLGAWFNVSNTVAAVAAAIAMGVIPKRAATALEDASPPPGRFEPVPTNSDYKVIVDYAHTPDALEKLLDSVRLLLPRRVLTVFGCGGDRDRGKRPKMAEAAAKRSEIVFVTSDNPRTEDPNAIIRDVMAGLPRNIEARVEPDRRIAITNAIAEAGAGDVVVIAGKGHEDYQIIGTKKTPFDDREVASEAIAERMSCV